MTLALMSRGYICLGRRNVPTGPGPKLVDAEDISPAIKASGFIADLAPSFVTGSELKPSGTGTSQPAPAPSPGPKIVAGKDLSPSITGVDEDE
jgi:hypothetical protein